MINKFVGRVLQMNRDEFRRSIEFYRSLAADEMKNERRVGNKFVGPRAEIKGKIELNHVMNPLRPFFSADTGLDDKYVSTFRMGHFNIPEKLSNSVQGTNYIGGMEFGKNLVRQKVVGDMDNLVSFLKEYKFGIFDLFQKEEHNGTEILDIRVYECIECASLPNIGKPACYFEAGMITGILMEMTKNEVNTEEIRCWTSGYSFCQFRVSLE